MGTSSRLATLLDSEMLTRLGVVVSPAATPLRLLPQVHNLAEQIGQRYLARYLLASQIGSFRQGASTIQFVTITPYAPEETVSWLALPEPNRQRTHVLLLDPAQVGDVYGPRWVRMGGGLEYILKSGFSSSAIVDISGGEASPPAIWEIELR